MISGNLHIHGDTILSYGGDSLERYLCVQTVCLDRAGGIVLDLPFKGQNPSTVSMTALIDHANVSFLYV